MKLSTPKNVIKFILVHMSKKRRNACTSRLLASDGLPTNEQTLRPKAQIPNVGDHCFLLSEFRDALVKYVLQTYIKSSDFTPV